MLLNQLFESVKANAAFAFGRFNPPHQGHVAVWNTVAKSGAEWFIGTNPGTSGAKDPLPYDVKTAWMTAIDPSVEGHIMPETSVLTLATTIYKQLGERQGLTIAYVTDDQDWAWSGKLLNDYNGKEATHGYYNFAKIIHVASPRVSSATALRDAARAGDMKAFYAAAGTDPDLKVGGKHYYDTVVDYLAQHPEKVKRVKKVAEPVTQEEAGGVGVVASKKQANDPRYSMSLTKDVRPGQVKKSLNAFRLESTNEEWSKKYKSSINCSNPKGFSQKAHCAGKKKDEDVAEAEGEYKVYYMTAEDHKLMGRYASREEAEQRLNQLQSEYPDNKFIIWKNSKQGVAEAISKKDLLNKVTKDLNSDKFKNTPVDPKHKGWTGPKKGDPNYVKNFGHGYADSPDNRSHDRDVKKSLKKDIEEEKQKGVDGKACWKGYKRMGTKQKGGKTVDNCVKIGEAYERKIASLIEQLKKK
jgi:hypothetical protein